MSNSCCTIPMTVESTRTLNLNLGEEYHGPYVLPTMSPTEKGGAMLGSGLEVTSEVLSLNLTDEATGESATADDASYLATIHVDGKAVQDGTPTPSTPVEIDVVQGLNLIEVNGGAPLSTTFDGYYKDLTVNNGLLSSFHLEECVTYTVSMEVTSNYEPFNASVGCCNGSYAKDISSKFSVNNGYISITFTPNATHLSSGNILALRVPRYGSSQTGVSFTVDKAQLEKGSTATPYVPYGSIGLKVNDAIHPIDLQGNVIASLPNGTKDELTVDSSGHVVLTKRLHMYNMRDYASNNSWAKSSLAANGYYLSTTKFTPTAKTYQRANVLCNVATGKYPGYSTTDNSTQVDTSFNFNLDSAVVGSTKSAFQTWLASNDLFILAELATPQSIDLGYIDMPAIPDGSQISITAQVTPTITASWWTRAAGAIAESLKSLRDGLLSRIEALETAIAEIAT